jgi:hypothetical protein
MTKEKLRRAFISATGLDDDGPDYEAPFSHLDTWIYKMQYGEFLENLAVEMVSKLEEYNDSK